MEWAVGIDLDALEGTLACDGNGRPIVVYHGTYAEFDRFGVTKDIGFHFGSEEQALRREEDKRKEPGESGPWRVIKAALAARKVLVVPDDARDWTNWWAVQNLADKVDRDFLPGLKAEGVTDSKVAAGKVRDLLVQRGYDAIVYRNLYEGRTRDVVDWSWIALHSDAVVMLPQDFRRPVVPHAVGVAPGLDLPSSAIDVPGIQNKSGGIRYVAERRNGVAAVAGYINALGGSFGPAAYKGSPDHDNTYPVKLPFCDCLLKGNYLASIGRLSLMVDENLGEALAGMVDDFLPFVGMKPGPINSLVYRWRCGETADDFVRRVGEGLSRAENMAARNGVTPAP